MSSTTLTNLSPDATISQIIEADQEAEQMLSSIGLKPADHLSKTLRSVCQQRQWNEVEVLDWIKKQQLSEAHSKKAVPDEEQQETLGQRYIFLKEHYQEPILQLLDEIEYRFPKVHKIHGSQYPWLKDMQWHFDAFVEALQMYYAFEEKKLLPLLNSLGDQKEILEGTRRKLSRSREIIERDQERLQRLMKILKKRGQGFRNPKGACSTMRILNESFKRLFAAVEEQLQLEKQVLLSGIKKQIQQIDA